MERNAPDFSLPDYKGDIHSLADFRGKWVVLYFYPKDNTPGCTKEAIDFTELTDEFEKNNCVVIGISKDSQKSHERFIDKQNLKILLLSDEDHSVQEQYGVWGKKKNYGKEYFGTIRSTFLIDSKGIIRKEWKNVKVKGHAEEVLKTLKELKD